MKNLSTVKSILETFEKAFLFFFVPKFDFSLKKQIQNPKKVYSIATGFVNKVGFSFSEDKGRILENLVFLQLKRDNEEIYYFSEKGKCDFVLRKGSKIYKAIQVCYELNKDNKDREVKGLVEAMDKFNLKQGMILTCDEKIKLDNKKIKVIPVLEWLLQSTKG